MKNKGEVFCHSFNLGKFQIVLVAVMAILLCTTVASATRTISDWTPIYEGVWKATGTDDDAQHNPPSPMKAYAVRVDLASPWVSMYASHSNGSDPYETALQTTPAFLSDHGLEVAVNANFYTPSGSNADNWGLLISNGTVVSSGVDNDHPYVMFRPSASCGVH